MLNVLPKGNKPAALERLLSDVQARKPVALTGLNESQSAFLSCLLADSLGKRVLVVCANDLKAGKLADDLHAFMGEEAALLPGGEIDLTRGTSSHESSWKRLSALTKCSQGSVRVLCTSMDAALQRMGSADNFRSATLRLKPGDVIAPGYMMEQLVRMGYERVSLVEGKGQCALRGSILDCFPPSESAGIRIEFFDDEVDGIRSFDCISQRTQEQLDGCVIPPACETVLGTMQLGEAAQRMRDALKRRNHSMPQTNLFDDLPPLPEDDEDLAAVFDQKIAPKMEDAARRQELERRTEYLMADADALDAGIPFRRLRAWLTVLTDETDTVRDWFRPDAVLLLQPDQLRDRSEDRQKGFSADLENAIERGEAVAEQQTLLMDWEELLSDLNGTALITAGELSHGMGGVRVEDAIDLQSTGITSLKNHIRELADDCNHRLAQGFTVVLLSGGVSRGKRLQETLAELGVQAEFSEAPKAPAPGQILILPITLAAGFVWPEAGLCVISDNDIYGGGGYHRSKSRKNAG